MAKKINEDYNQGEHFWEPMKEYKLDEEDNTNQKRGLEDKIEEKVNILRKMKPNQYIIAMILPAKETNTQPFLNYIEKLKEEGLDIDKSDSVEYGYKMPSAEKGKKVRELKIFRREIRKEKIFRRK